MFPFVKINYDTIIQDTFSAQAVVCKDSSGSILQCSFVINHPCTTVYGEATSALLVVQLALSLKLSSFILEGDSFTVTLTLQKLDIIQD
jgi:hypothetical protein